MPSRKAPRRKVNAARREATQQEKRLYAKQFLEAKHGEIKSWTEENDVYELVDMRKLKVQNFITGRWVFIQLIWEQDLKEQPTVSMMHPDSGGIN